MVKKKVDNRVRGLIESGVRKGHRSLFILVGDYGLYQVENIHKILAKARVKARPSVLWCYKKELAYSSHKKKRIKQIKKNQARGLHDPDRDDPFDLFISSTNIRWTYYKETDKILGQTFGMCVLQDFEAITPNLLARTIETVEGGGIVILLLKTVKSLKQLYTMTMDVHARFRTEAHHEIVPRFNERFILSLADCEGCLVLDDELNILPISSKVNSLPVSEGLSAGLEDGDADASGYAEDPALQELKASFADTPNVGSLIALAKTIDQAKVIMSFLDAISEKTLRSTVALTAARGRGKSAAIGLCLAGAIGYGYSNIFVTAPSPENLKTVFEFIVTGLRALKYTEHMDFEVLSEHHGDIGKVPVRINIYRDHRQTIQYVLPSDHLKLAQAELVAIDEAAAIPLPVVRKLLGPYLVFMSTTVNGYEGTGRALSLKLIQQLRTQQGSAITEAALQAGAAVSGPKSRKKEHHVHEERWKSAATAAANGSSASSTVRVLKELTLETPIRYTTGDPVEQWLNRLLCMDVVTHSSRIGSLLPAPRDCELYLVDRDALFSYHPLAEGLLQRIWALYTAAHYKNSPNDLQMLSDAPAHRLYLLLGPSAMENAAHTPSGLPDVLCVVQVALEGKISAKSVQSELGRGNKASGDLIPWTISQQFNDMEFASLSGARIVRIATHPDVQHMGYGSRAIDILIDAFQGQGQSQLLEEEEEEDEAEDDEDDGVVQLGAKKGNTTTTSTHSSTGNPVEVDPDDDQDPLLLKEPIQPKAKLPPLLTTLTEGVVATEQLHWLGVSFGLTSELLNFWSRKKFKACYIRQSCNDLTGEHSAIMLRELQIKPSIHSDKSLVSGWLNGFVTDYRRRMISLLSYSFRSFDTALALTLVDPDKDITSMNTTTTTSASSGEEEQGSGGGGGGHDGGIKPLLTAVEVRALHLTPHDLKRLEMYSRNMVDHHQILDLLPTIAKLMFLGRLSPLRLSTLQAAIILAVGLQHRDVDSVAHEIDLPVNQVLAFFNKTVRKLSTAIRSVVEAEIESELPNDSRGVLRVESSVKKMNALSQSLQQDQKDDVRTFLANQKKTSTAILSSNEMKGHVVAAADDELQSALLRGIKRQDEIPNMVSAAVPVVSSSSSVPTRKRESMEADITDSSFSGGSNDLKKKKKKKKKFDHPVE